MGRSLRSTVLVAAAVAAFAACDDDVFVVPAIEPPSALTYELEPSGDPLAPAGILLRWNPPLGVVVEFYRVYSRPANGSFGPRGETTSLSFHDLGIPHLEYFVTAVTAAGESEGTNVVQVDERLRLESPATLSSISLNGAVHLHWSDNPFLSAPSGFREYRVYSASYSLDENVCGVAWVLEGTTVAPEFLAGALANGVPRCYGVSAVSVEGWESLWSPIRTDTPRPDARNVLVWVYGTNTAQSGFRFWLDGNGDRRAQASELGLVLDGNRSDLDFWVFRDPADGSLWLVPERPATTLRLYGTTPIADLTVIDVAPVSGYARDAHEAVPGFGYVFQMDGGDGFYRYGGLRVTHVGRDYLIFDWSFQDDPGNPELSVGIGGAP